MKENSLKESVQGVCHCSFPPFIADDAVKILIAAERELGVLDRRTGIYEPLVPVNSRPTSVTYDLDRSMYFWVDEALHVFVLGKPNPVPLYPGIFLDIQSPGFLSRLQQSISGLCIHLDVVWDSLIVTPQCNPDLR